MSTLLLVLGALLEPVCHLFGLPHPENLPAMLTQVSLSAHGLPLRRRGW